MEPRSIATVSGQPRGICHDSASRQHSDHDRRWRDLFWAIDKFVRDSRLANLLKLLVVLICLAAILQRVLPLAGIY